MWGEGIAMNQELFERVYLSVLGELLEPVAGVENAFQEGSACDVYYEDMLAAYARLRERLNAGEDDADVEIIISSLRKIADYLCSEMFRYGWEMSDGK
jgi:hypothetical protein